LTPMPRKIRRQLTEDELKLLEKLSAIRLPLDMICDILEIGETDLRELKKKNDNVRRAFRGGLAKSSRDVRTTLYHMAVREKNFQALRFWCETQENFKRADKLEISGIPNAAPIKVETHSVTKEELKESLIALRRANELTEDE
jgi:hypothetical protein